MNPDWNSDLPSHVLWNLGGFNPDSNPRVNGALVYLYGCEITEPKVNRGAGYGHALTACMDHQLIHLDLVQSLMHAGHLC